MFESLLATLVRVTGFKGLKSNILDLPDYRVELACGEVDGKIYLISGSDRNDTTKVMYVYDTANNTYDVSWPAFVGPGVYFSGSAALDKFVYVFGGKGHKSGGPYSTMYRLNTVTKAWETMAVGSVRWQHRCFAYNGKIYAFAGSTDASGNAASMTNEMLVYDVATNAWSTLAPVGTAPVKRGQYAGVRIGDKYYCAGGFDGTVLADAWEYDIPNNKWRQLASLPKGGYGGFCFQADGRLFYGSGTSTTNADPVIYEYSFDNDNWTKFQDYPEALLNTAVCCRENRVYLFGGSINGTVGNGEMTSRMLR